MSHTLIRSRILREHPLSGTSKVGLEGDKDERRNYGSVAVSMTFNVLIMDHVRNWLWWRFSGAEESVLSFEIHKTKASRTSSSFLSCECLESRSMWAPKEEQEEVEWRNNRKNQIKRLYMSRTFWLSISSRCGCWWRRKTFLLVFVPHIHPVDSPSCHSISLHAAHQTANKNITEKPEAPFMSTWALGAWRNLIKMKNELKTSGKFK